MASKLVVTDTRTNQTFDFQLTRAETRVGRAGDRSDLVLDDGQVSRVHAVVKRTQLGFGTLAILGSRGVLLLFVGLAFRSFFVGGFAAFGFQLRFYRLGRAAGS